jgi:hypothetical protein
MVLEFSVVARIACGELKTTLSSGVVQEDLGVTTSTI